MKNLLVLSCIYLFSCNPATETKIDATFVDSGFKQKGTAVEDADTALTADSKVAAIRTAVQAINSQTLQVQSFNWSEPSCADVGTITYYLNNDEIVKVIETGFIGDGGWIQEYYYSKGKFIFSFEQNIGGPAGLPADTNEMRIYMNADTLVLQKKNKKDLDDVSKKLTPASREYRILKAWKDKNFGEVLCN
ncbi:MAG: hypothetical protein H7Y86_06805 [Rhizobacter sp.]|nr:hypothetical protein [Ferruginibacter sp.]